jgi:hypothetical protein
MPHNTGTIAPIQQATTRVIGKDLHRTFAEVVFWEDGKLCPAGRVNMTRAGLERFGRSLSSEDEIVIEATGRWRWCACYCRMWRE